jgi:D-alanyl-D-alanine carboxypeptidase
VSSPERGAEAGVRIDHGGTDLIPIRAMTADYGGGGLASTTHDRFRFLRGVVSGRLLHDPSSLGTRWDFEPDGQGAEYGLRWSRYADEAVSLIGHGGTGGARMFYEESFGIFVGSTVNQSGTDVELLDPVLTAVILSLR